ncbi:MAG: nitroreductase [Pseudomonadota bacterium]
MPTAPLKTAPARSVTEAMETRVTVRQFLDKPVPRDVLTKLLDTARRTPSGGNLQPWRVHVLTGDKLKRFVAAGLDKAKGGPPETPSYPAYPEPLWEPKKTWRREVGYALYELMGIERHDKMGRMGAALRNMEFFDAPVGLIVTADERCGVPQYMDIGIYLQSLMLLAREAGLHTAPQGWWRQYPSLPREHLDYPDTEEVVVGMSLGYGDPDAAVNTLYADRAQLGELVHFYEE